MNAPRRARGRPRRDAGHEPLTKDRIGRVALDIAGAEGFPSLTMRRLADELGVTVRALYNVVADRQEVVDLAAGQLVDMLPEHDFDVADWAESVRRMYRDARAAYRKAPRATLISLDETVTPGMVPIGRILSAERMLAFLVTIGLPLEDALRIRAQFLVDVFGFVLLIDYRYDRSDELTRTLMRQPVPQPWLDAHPDVPAPHSRAAVTAGDGTPDDLYESVIDRALLTIATLRAQSSRD